MLQFCLSRGSGTTNTRTLYPYMHGEGLPGQRDGAVTAFGPLLRRLRMAAGLSQEALAERARISTEAVGALERGTRQAPQRQTLALLIEALKVEGPERERLELAAVRPAVPRRRQAGASLVGVVSAMRLPIPLTSFVGREVDLAVLRAALSEARLVSLVGPGGVGKSRLALEAARLSGEQFSEGVVLVELAPVATGASVVSAFASAIGVADEGSVRLLDRLTAVCGTGRRLILVDNCEHVLDDVATVVYALLRACPNVRVIATSREPLRVEGEHISRLGPLAGDAALALFMDRAKAVAPYLQFEAEARRLASQICRRVDGIPLAIELAASRTDVFDLATILKRLEERFKLLSARSRTMHPHHRTLRALVDWSYDLLDAEEVRVFRRLGIFAGGCRFDDAEKVLAFDGIQPEQVVDLLARLHDKSLVDIDRGEPPRASMLQTIHDYACERLTDANESARLEVEFAKHYLDLVRTAGPALRSAGQTGAIARLSADIDNIRAALSLSRRHDVLRESGLHALGALAQYWMRTGGLTEASERIGSMTLDIEQPSLGLAWACVGGAFVEFNLGRVEAGNVYAARAREAAAACGDEWLTTYSSSAVLWGRSEVGEDVYALAASSHERAQALGDAWLLSSTAYELAGAARAIRDEERAAKYFGEALERALATGDKWMVCASSLQLGRTLAGSEPARAVRLVADAIDCLLPEARLARANCIESLVEIALLLGRSDDAARLVGIASDLRTSVGGRPNGKLVERVRAARGDAAIDGTTSAQTPLAEAHDAVRAFLAVATAAV